MGSVLKWIEIMQKTIFDSFARRDGSLENSYPRLAAPFGPTINAAAWTWSAYAQLVASTPSDFVASFAALSFTAIVQVAGAGALQSINGELELAIGGAGSEVAFATIPIAYAAYELLPGASTQVFFAVGRDYPLAPKFIPSGSRIAARGRISLTNTLVRGHMRCYVIGYDGGNAPAGFSTYTLRGQQTGIQKGQSYVVPAGSTLTVTPGAGAWGSWTQVIASASGELLVIGAAVTPATTTVAHWDIMEMGTGSAGNEVTRARMWFPSVYYCNAHLHFMHRPLLVKPGERLAVRTWSVTATPTLNCQFLYEQH